MRGDPDEIPQDQGFGGGIVSVGWNEYLGASDTCAKFCECHRRCKSSFEEHYRNIQVAIEATQPKVVACLGAGVLNDIPYESMIRSGASIHLVDWIPDSIDTGIDLSIIQNDESGQPHCIYCHPTVTCPQAYCRNYRSSSRSAASVCRSFVSTPGTPPRCAAYERGDQPGVHYEDVTAGYGAEFGREILAELRGVRSWRQAFVRAQALANRVDYHRTCTTIADASVQFVTSSMVISQFDHEPYEYFSHCAADLLGPPIAKEEKQLLPLMKSLRETLLAKQVVRHCEEIKRILAPGGYCYISFEMFHVVPEKPQWFLVEGMATALDIIGRHFVFDFDLLPQDQQMSRFRAGDAASLVFSFLLTHRNGSAGASTYPLAETCSIAQQPTD